MDPSRDCDELDVATTKARGRALVRTVVETAYAGQKNEGEQ